MVKNNILITTKRKKPKKLVEEVQVWDYEIKKSSLSPAARSRVINKSGSGYVSENQENYGPMPPILIDDIRRFYVKIGYNAIFRNSDGDMSNRYEFKNMEEARNFLRQMENGEIKIVTREGLSRLKWFEEDVKKELRECIRENRFVGIEIMVHDIGYWKAEVEHR